MKKLFTLIFLIAGCMYSFSQPNIEKFKVNQKNTWEILEDDHGNIWFHPGNLQAYNSNIVRYDGEEFHVSKKIGDHNALCVYSMSKDKYKNVWFSGPYGLGKFDGQETKVFNKKDGLPSNNVAYVYSAKDGTTWVSTGKSFPIKPGKLGKIIDDKYIPITDSPIENNVCYIYTDTKGNMWFGCRGEGFYKYDGSMWTDYTEQTNLQWITYITEDHDGNIWFAGLEGYFSRFDGNEFFEYRLGEMFYASEAAVTVPIIGFIKVDAGSLPKIVVDDNNNVWVLIRKRGIMVYKDKKMVKLKDAFGLPSGSPEYIRDILKDSKGNIWLGFSTGLLLKFDGNNWEIFKDDDALPQSIYALHEDSEGNIWVANSLKAISRISYK